MNTKEYQYQLGRLAGLEESFKLIEKSEDGDLDFITFQLLKKIDKLRTKLSGTTVHDCECKRKARELLKDVEYEFENAPTFDEMMSGIRIAIRDKFNLSEGE